MRRVITEEDNVHEEWYEAAENMTLAELPEFLRHITEDYEHSYVTSVHAIAAGIMAITWATINDEQGGISGLQAGTMLWKFITCWTHRKPSIVIEDIKARIRNLEKAIVTNPPHREYLEGQLSAYRYVIAMMTEIEKD